MNVSDRASIVSKLTLPSSYNTGGDPNYARLETLTNCGLAVLNLKYSNQFDNSNAMAANATPVAWTLNNDVALTCA